MSLLEAPSSVLPTEARLALLHEVLHAYDSEGPTVEVGDVVVTKDYMSLYKVPNLSRPGVVHEVFPPARGHDIGETGWEYISEVYDCTVAMLHEQHGSATLVFVPMNTHRLKKYEPTE